MRGFKEHNMVALWWNRTGKPLGDMRLKNEQQVYRIAERQSCVWKLRKVGTRV